ncbi:MAG: hypothetical protein GEU79_04655 [Acidimicrobiia bacterium]|nr:hypothetical protein [Acidimicrobiia bacterium]
MQLGSIRIEVIAPKRRYASPNDQSVVLAVEAGARDLLLTGDVEEIAQEELPDLKADILKVPHQGAATSDPEWLQAIGADIAVVSVGPNDFGHPSPEMIDALRNGGARIRRTDLEGDVVVPLD